MKTYLADDIIWERYEKIIELAEKLGRFPTYTEIMDAIGLKSKSGVHFIVTHLKEMGYLNMKSKIYFDDPQTPLQEQRSSRISDVTGRFRDNFRISVKSDE